MKRTFLLLILLCIHLNGYAAIYKGTDPSGRTIYSDQPLPNGKEVEVQSLPTYTPPPLPETVTTPAETEEINYQVQILEPMNDQTFTTDIQKVTVRVSLTPELQEGDSVILLLNNQPYGSNDKTLNFYFENLARGSYELQAQVVNAEGKVKAKSETITFYQKRNFINRNLNTFPKPPVG